MANSIKNHTAATYGSSLIYCKLTIALFFLCTAALACLPEAEFRQKQKNIEAECGKISLAVPCAIGMGEVDREDLAIDKSQRDAIAKLARSVKAFVSYAASDSSWVENGNSQEFSIKISKINVEAELSGTQPLASECTQIEENGKKRFKVITLVVLDRALYVEAQKEVATLPASDTLSITKSSSSSEATTAIPTTANAVVANKQTINTAVKAKLKNIAVKSFNILLNMAKKWVGFPQ